MHGKLTAWLLILLAVVFLARPQGAEVKNESSTIASAEYTENDSNDEAIILFIVIVVFIIGASANACETEEI